MSWERRCICRHHEQTHLFDGVESVCMHEGCKCKCFHLWEVAFFDPWGAKHVVCDIAKFVRDRADLFTDSEREIHGPKTSKGNRSEQAYTNAETGLGQVGRGEIKSWHNWTLCHFPKTYIEPKS